MGHTNAIILSSNINKWWDGGSKTNRWRNQFHNVQIDEQNKWQKNAQGTWTINSGH